MNPKTLNELRELIDANAVVDSADFTALPMAIVGAFDALAEKEGLTDSEKRLSWELSLRLMTSNYSGRAGAAQQQFMRLATENSGFEWRPVKTPGEE